jgi:4,5-DOPA dioxygenase extradiol
MTGRMARMPCIFVAHGSPLLRDDAKWTGELRAWAEALPRPKYVVVLSAHWVTEGVTIGSSLLMPIQHDFTGLPKAYYDVTYAPNYPQDLEKRIKELLEPAGPVTVLSARGLDHGAYVPLVAMYPAADVPVLQMALPGQNVEALVSLGERLAPLRDEEVLLVATGFLTHNPKAVSYRKGEPPPDWAKQFDGWVADVLQKRDAKALARFRQAPGARMAHPTPEHLVPVGVALGASIGQDEPVTFPITGWAYGSMSKRSVQFG